MESRRLAKILDNVSPDWNPILYSRQKYRLGKCMVSSAELLDKILEVLSTVDDEVLCPEPDKWFEFARLTPLATIKIVIIGQDPYHTKTRDGCAAHGLAFSCLTGIPPSLRNIYKCLENTGMIRSHRDIKSGDLTHWAKQGVLLLNRSLSTEVAKPNAHQNIWTLYTEFIIQRVCEHAFDRMAQLIFFLWGRNAQNISQIIDTDFHIVNNWAHPSPMAQGALSIHEKFHNCDHFKSANALLREWDAREIEWAASPPNPAAASPPNPAAASPPNPAAASPPNPAAASPPNPAAASPPNPAAASPPNPAAASPPNPAAAADLAKTNWFNGHSKKIIVFTDGSCHPNKKSPAARGGFASVFAQGPFSDKIIYGNLDTSAHYASNIRAEGQAIISALEFIGSEENKVKWTECVIVTDCEFWINMINKYMPKWSDAKFKQKENYDMTSKLWKIWKTLMESRELSLYHVNSHNKSGWKTAKVGTFERYCYDYNDYVDKLCGYARLGLKPGETSMSEVDYD